MANSGWRRTAATAAPMAPGVELGTDPAQNGAAAPSQTAGDASADGQARAENLAPARAGGAGPAPPRSREAQREVRREARTEGVRERILNTARDLFYRDGARAVGVDTVVAQSGVAKTSLYRWFPSKDALIVAVLEAEAADRWKGWDRIAAGSPAEPRERLRAMLAGIERYVSSERYRGCPFMNVTVEFPDAQHPARRVALETSEELRRRLRSLVDPLGVPDPALLTEQLLMLVQGAFSTAQIFGARGPQHQLVAAADALVHAQLAR